MPFLMNWLNIFICVNQTLNEKIEIKIYIFKLNNKWYKQ